MTEALSYWLMITLFLALERYLATHRNRCLVWFALLCVAAVLARPIFLPLPAVLLLLLAAWAWRAGELHHRWKSLLLAGALTYGLVLGYAGANGVSTGYLGVSDASNIDLFARVLRYDMYPLPLRGSSARQYATLQAQIIAHVNQGGLLAREPWGFIAQHPVYQQHYMETLRAFAEAEIEQHPLYYVEHSLPDIWYGFYADPFMYASVSYAPAWVLGLYALYHFYARAFVVFPLLLVAVGYHVWRHPRDRASVLALALLVAYALMTLMGTLFSYEGFWRLRFPTEWAMTLVGTIYAVMVVRWLARGLATWRRALAGQPPEVQALAPHAAPRRATGSIQHLLRKQ
jgi:hypothetical protein